jgi:hypothetical protein
LRPSWKTPKNQQHNLKLKNRRFLPDLQALTDPNAKIKNLSLYHGLAKNG